MQISGYQIREKFYESDHSQIVRGTHEESGRPVVVKILNKEYPTSEEIARFRREYEITCKLQNAGGIRTYDFFQYQNTYAIAFEDFGGMALSQHLNSQPLGLESFIPLAIRIVEVLEKIHHAYIIHKDLNPSNIVWNPETGVIKIIDFGISSELSRETPSMLNLNVLEGSLFYISPEQTGRMNRIIDYRTDLYSLGVTFYEMLTGCLPFSSPDSLELVHCHIAKTPPLPHELNPQIPPVLSQIIMKLMSKVAEDRYQSGFGLKADLHQCGEQYKSKGWIDEFEIGSRDIPERFEIPQKLYGREIEIEKLIRAFERAAQERELVLVSGFSGIGKSTIIHEVHKPVIQKKRGLYRGKV